MNYFLPCRVGVPATREGLMQDRTIAVIGAGIGIVLALPLNFVSTGTSNFVTFSEIAFNFRVTPDLMVSALIFGSTYRLPSVNRCPLPSILPYVILLKSS